MRGFYNRLLLIDVTAGTSEIRPLSDELLSRTLGGKGLATHLLLQHNPREVDPHDPQNHILFALGPLSGTGIWGSCRHGIYTKSPQTGYYSESYSGGTVAEYMAGSGFDAVMVRGCAREPVWIEVDESGASFHSATDLWGKDTYQTEDRVKQRLADQGHKAGVACIGPAGENRVSFAVIENDYWRSAGRTGVGAVFGSKRIKAMAFRGKREKTLAEPENVKQFIKEFAKEFRNTPGVQAYKTKQGQGRPSE
jgi:aldehyde:ferredoxin oxidoreductase